MADWRFGRSLSRPRFSARPRSRRCWAGPRLKHHLVALLLILAVGDASKAAVDLTGDWNMALLDMDAFLVPIVQTGSSLQVGGIPGTIDASTGSFQSQTSRGYRYKDPAAAVYGIEKIVLRGSTRNTTRVRVIGKGTELADLPLPVTAPLIVQLANGDNGICWGVSYSAAQLLENEPGRLKAKAP
jgi:hypothetical protein